MLPDDDSRTVRFVISDESKDRHNSIVPVDAWDLENFRENPIAGWGHDVYGFWSAPDPDNIIGSWDVWTENNELLGDLTFEDAETNPKADKLFRKVRNGTLNAVSVGFLPKKQHEGDKEKDEEEGVTYYDDVELIEASLVVIGSNPRARKKALENGDIPELAEELVEELKKLVGTALGDKLNEDDFEKLTIKGLLATLHGGDADEVMDADTKIKIKGEDLVSEFDSGQERNKPTQEELQEHYKRLAKLLEEK